MIPVLVFSVVLGVLFEFLSVERFDHAGTIDKQAHDRGRNIGEECNESEYSSRYRDKVDLVPTSRYGYGTRYKSNESRRDFDNAQTSRSNI